MAGFEYMLTDLSRQAPQFYIYLPCLNAHLAKCFNVFSIVKALVHRETSRRVADSSNDNACGCYWWCCRVPAQGGGAAGQSLQAGLHHLRQPAAQRGDVPPGENI